MLSASTMRIPDLKEPTLATIQPSLQAKYGNAFICQKKLNFILTTYQDNFREVVEAKGIKSPAYYSAFAHMRKQCRENGIDAALHPTVNGKKISLDALLFCDVRGAGQQIAAQACTFHSSNNCSEDEILY